MPENDIQKTEGRSTLSNAIYEIFIAALTLLSLVLISVYYILPISEETQNTIIRVDFMLSLIFLFDSFRSLIRATNKVDFIKWGWLDFLGSVPLVFPLRFARLGRLVRAWRIFRERGPKRVIRDFRENLAESAFLVTVFFAILIISISSRTC